MLAGDRPARVDAGDQDLVREVLGALGLALDAPVVEDEWMQVPVSRVEHVADAQPGLPGELLDPAQHLRQLGARHDAVLHVVVRADPSHRREGRLAAAPDLRTVVGLGRDADLARAVLAADRLDALEVALDLGERPVELDDQHRAAAVRVVRVHRRLGCLDRDRVHHLDRGRQDPLRDRVRDRGTRLVGVAEAGEQRAHRLRSAQHAQRQLRRDPERALGADESAEQAGPLVPDGELDDLAVRQDDLGGEHVVDREAVLEAMRAARVLRDVAADRADLLRRRVGGVVEALGGDRLRHVEVGDARLDRDAAALDVDLEDPRQPRE